jgi:hypothetical protein
MDTSSKSTWQATGARRQQGSILTRKIVDQVQLHDILDHTGGLGLTSVQSGPESPKATWAANADDR